MKVAVLLPLLVQLACSAAGAPPSSRPPPPRRIGESIDGTRMCECRACSPASCCADEGLSRPDGDDYGLTVSSCEPRCAAFMYRVPVRESCEGRRPEACCAG